MDSPPPSEQSACLPVLDKLIEAAVLLTLSSFLGQHGGIMVGSRINGGEMKSPTNVSVSTALVAFT